MKKDRDQPISKKVWSVPQLTIHGNIEKVTQEVKDYYGFDGIYVQDADNNLSPIS